jgi:hypothetical protein
MTYPEVQATAKAATLWCQHATEATKDLWTHLLIPHPDTSEWHDLQRLRLHLPLLSQR